MMRKEFVIMPKYELMYIVASTVSDDQIPAVTDGVLRLIGEVGGTVEREEKLGKKKLAYPIKKTRNGFYDVVVFDMPGAKLGELDTKILNTEGIIRHIVVNIEEMLERQAKDLVEQEKMNKTRGENAPAGGIPASAERLAEEKPQLGKVMPAAPTTPVAPAAPLSDEALDEKIDAALNINI
jgi:small subunit ribosomal protein S6